MTTTTKTTEFHSEAKAAETNAETIARLTIQQKETDELVHKLYEMKPALNSINKAFECFKNSNVSVSVEDISIPVLREVAIHLDLNVTRHGDMYWATMLLEGGAIHLKSKKIKTIEVEE